VGLAKKQMWCNAVAWCVGCTSFVFFEALAVSFIFLSFAEFGYDCSNRVSHNVLQLGEVADFEALTSNLALMFF
jgi:hypothetical protein